MRCLIECLDGCLAKKNKEEKLEHLEVQNESCLHFEMLATAVPPPPPPQDVTGNFVQVKPGNEKTNDNHTLNISRCLL